MARDYWDFNEHADDFIEFLRELNAPVGPSSWKITEDGRILQVPAPVVTGGTFTIRHPSPPDPPEWVRKLNEEANAPPPEWIRRLNAQARLDAIMSRENTPDNDDDQTDPE